MLETLGKVRQNLVNIPFLVLENIIKVLSVFVWYLNRSCLLYMILGFPLVSYWHVRLLYPVRFGWAELAQAHQNCTALIIASAMHIEHCFNVPCAVNLHSPLIYSSGK